MKWRARVEASLMKQLEELQIFDASAEESKATGRVFTMLKIRRESEAIQAKLKRI